MVSETIFNYYNSMTKEELVNTCLNQHIANRALLQMLNNKDVISEKDFEIFRQQNEEIRKLKVENQQLKLQKQQLELQNKWLKITINTLDADLEVAEERVCDGIKCAHVIALKRKRK